MVTATTIATWMSVMSAAIITAIECSLSELEPNFVYKLRWII